ncbi:MAG: flagellar hook-associated protein FlgK [Candidatus Zixiibacteriota bacterium]|nr:MAG: flagellar hook-associated protein FlgK [candidate division Zixibacteria bacterium]
MPGLFQGLEIGRKALMTHQLTLQTIGHNIANVDTPGYTRQRVNVTTTLPEVQPIGIIGSGMTVSTIRHVRDLFLGQQYREESKSLGQWTYKERILSEVETMFNEPSDNTLATMLNGFWDSWSALSTYDGDRSNVLAVAQRLSNGFHQVADELNRLRESIDLDLANLVRDVNRLTAEIASTNNQIASTELGDTRANDLRDRRDLYIDELSALVDVNAVEQENGEVTVYIGAMSIVNGKDYMPIAVELDNVDGQPLHRLIWEGTSVELKCLNGQLKGLTDARDEIIPRYLEQLDTLARTLVQQVNAIHVTGYGADGSTGVDFFDPAGLDALSIRVNPDIVSNVSRIATSATGEAGDQQIAVAISKLRDAAVLEDDTLTINDFYNALVGTMGAEAHEAQSFTNNFELLLQQIEFARQSVQGVSLDEEMTNMIKYQHAYDAAARVITTMDQALETVISWMGVVGR